MRGHRKIYRMADGRVSLSVVFGQATPQVGMYASLWPCADTVQQAVETLLECKAANVPARIAGDVQAAYVTAKIRSAAASAPADPLEHWPAPVYDEQWQCSICTRGGFCQEAANELAHDIACILVMAGDLPPLFDDAKADVLRWMAANNIRGGDALTRCNEYMSTKQVPA
jgi:hypothetical protein